MPPRKAAQMDAEELAAKVDALKPAWAQEYIRQLEKITRTLASQLQAAKAQGAGDLTLAREISGARDRLAEQAQVPFYAQFSAWARGTAPIPPGIPDARRAFPGIPDPILAACFRQLSQETPGLLLANEEEQVQSGPAKAVCEQHPQLPRPGCAACETLSLAEWKARYARAGQPADPQLVLPDGKVVSTSIWTGAGITPPDGEYATVRVLDGAAMEPVADLDDRAEIRFADFYQVHYGGHEGTGGMRVLVIEGDDEIIIHPVSKTTVLVSRGGYTQRA